MRKALVLVFLFSASAYAGGQFKGPSLAILASTQSSGGGASAPVEDLANILSYWKLDENGGTSAADSAGTMTGTLQNTPTWAVGISGSALTFNAASTQRVDLINPPSIGDSATWTVSAWYKGTTTSNGTIYSEGNTDASGDRIAMTINHDVAGDFACVVLDQASGDGYFSSGNLGVNDGNWHHLVCTSESKGHRNMYKDGVFIKSNNVSLGTLALNTANIGAIQLSTLQAYLTGTADQIRTYSVAKTTAQVLNLYQLQK